MAEKLATAHAPKVVYQARTTGGDENQLEMLRKYEQSKDLKVFFYSKHIDHHVSSPQI